MFSKSNLIFMRNAFLVLAIMFGAAYLAVSSGNVWIQMFIMVSVLTFLLGLGRSI